jgi:hypothetical protein
MDSMSMNISTVTYISHPRGKSPLIVDDVKTICGREFIELSRGHKGLQLWLTGSKCYSTKVSTLIGEMTKLQVDASKLALGQAGDAPLQDCKTKSKERSENKALKQLANRSNIETVDVLLPAFEHDDVRVLALHTQMPFSLVCGHCASALVPLQCDVLKWLFLRCEYLERPEKRKYDACRSNATKNAKLHDPEHIEHGEPATDTAPDGDELQL